MAALVMMASAAAGPAAAIELPSYTDGAGTELVPSFSLEGAFFPQSQSWFGKSRDNLGAKSDYWFEEVAKLGLDGQVALSRYGNLYGRVSGFFAATQRTDAAGSNVPGDTPNDVAWEDAYVGWKSGTLFEDSLGTDALDLSYGRQRYQVGSGFLFWSGASNGGQRAAYWIGPRKAFKQAAIAKIDTHGIEARGVFLEGNDNPDSNTQLFGADLEWGNEDLGSIGAGFYHIFNSYIDTRDGMDIYDIRADLTPLRTLDVLPGLTLKGEYTFEENGDVQKGYGYHGFREDDLYPYCGGPDGMFTAHPELMGSSLRELRDKRGNPLGQWLYEAARQGEIDQVTYYWPRPGSTRVLQKVALVTRIGDQVCAVGYYRPRHRGKESVP